MTPSSQGIEYLTFAFTVGGMLIGGVFAWALVFFRVQQQEKLNQVYWKKLDKLEEQIALLSEKVTRVDTQMQDFHRAAYRAAPGASGL